MHDDGTVTIVGTAGTTTGFVGPFGAGTLIRSGSVQFSMFGDAPAPRVRCTGELCEARHGEPSGPITGQLVGIRWRPDTYQTSADGAGMIITGHEQGEELHATGDWLGNAPGDLTPWSLEFTIRVSD